MCVCVCVVASFWSNGVKDGSLQVVWIPSTVQKHACEANWELKLSPTSPECRLPAFPTVTARMSSSRDPLQHSMPEETPQNVCFLTAVLKWTRRNSILLQYLLFWLGFDSSLTFGQCHLVKIKAILKKKRQSTIVICRCLHWMKWTASAGTSRYKP